MQTLTLTPTPFIGRTREIDEIGALLDDPACRLLTLVGAGGIGKTRLALEIATHKKEAFPDGVFFVGLAPLSRPEDILTAIVEAMPVCFQQDNRHPREQFFDYLREKETRRLLLVLDNFEHLLDGVDIVSDILAATTHLKILVTSREALNLQEEWVRQLAGLSYPEHVNGTPLEAYGAVQLFVNRARRIRGDFDLSEDSSSVVEICRLVEGMPLAIELAVGWLRTLRLPDIAKEIRQNMDILATRSRNLPERHRSIRSVFSHSWQLILEDERVVFQKLSVFRGGFTREAAEVVAGASLHTLAGLVDKSLVRLSASGRYDIHELLRQFGAEQMDAAQQTMQIQWIYIEYYLGRLHQLERDIKGQQQIAALDSIETDFENVRNAWKMAIQHGHFTALNQAVESLHFFADMRGRYHEVVGLLWSTIEQLTPTTNPEQQYIIYRIQARMMRLIVLGNMRIDFDLDAQLAPCLADARARQDQPEIGFCLLLGGVIAVWENKNDPLYISNSGLVRFQECLAVYNALNDTFYRAEVLSWLSSVTPSGKDEDGVSILKQSLELRREIGDKNGVAWLTLNLTEFALSKLDYVGCEQYAREALTLMREIGSVKGILQSMFKLTQMILLKGELAEARRLGEQLRHQAEETNNLDGKMLSLGLLAFLLGVMDENYAEAAVLGQKSHAISLEPFFGGHDVLVAHWGRAIAACGLGRYESCRQCYNTTDWERYDDPGQATICLALEAAVCAHEGRLEEAVELLSLAFHQPGWASGWMQHWQLLTRLRADLLRQLGEEAYQCAWERGSQQPLETMIRSIVGHDAPVPQFTANQALIEPLSERELEILSLIADGLSNRDIAERLVLSVGTVKVHTRNIYGKLNVNSRTQALAQASRFSLL